MFAYLRCLFPALVTLIGVSLSPAFSNPIADRSNPKAATEQAAAPGVSQETCLSRPGNSTIAGQRWVYRSEGNRKCWFQTTEHARIKKPGAYRSANASVAASAENESIRPKARRVEDAQAKLVPLRPESPQAQFTLGQAAKAADPVPIADRAFLLTGELDQPEPDKRAAPQLDVDIFLTSAPSQRVASHTSQALDDTPGRPTTRIAVLLMMLGFSAILISNRAIRETVMLRHKGAQI